MPNAPKAGTKLVGIRLPLDIIERAKRQAQMLAEQTPGLDLSFHDAIRITLAKHLPPLDSEAEPAAPGKPPGSRGTPTAKPASSRKSPSPRSGAAQGKGEKR